MKRTLHVVVDNHAARSDEGEIFRIGHIGGCGLRQDSSPLSVVRERLHHAAVALAEHHLEEVERAGRRPGDDGEARRRVETYRWGCLDLSPGPLVLPPSPPV